VLKTGFEDLGRSGGEEPNKEAFNMLDKRQVLLNPRGERIRGCDGPLTAITALTRDEKKRLKFWRTEKAASEQTWGVGVESAAGKPRRSLRVSGEGKWKSESASCGQDKRNPSGGGKLQA